MVGCGAGVGATISLLHLSNGSLPQRLLCGAMKGRPGATASSGPLLVDVTVTRLLFLFSVDVAFGILGGFSW